MDTDGNYFVNRLMAIGDSLIGIGEVGILRPTGKGAEWKHDDKMVPAGAQIATSTTEDAGTPNGKPNN